MSQTSESTSFLGSTEEGAAPIGNKTSEIQTESGWLRDGVFSREAKANSHSCRDVFTEGCRRVAVYAEDTDDLWGTGAQFCAASKSTRGKELQLRVGSDGQPQNRPAGLHDHIPSPGKSYNSQTRLAHPPALQKPRANPKSSCSSS